MRLIEIPDDGIIRIPIMEGETTVGERRIDLSHIPTIEIEQVKHGRWVKDIYEWNEVPTSYCSCCGQGIADECIPWFKHCSNCGAKMDKEE